jgi:hypothetical protein
MPALVQSIKPLDFVAVKMVRLDLEGRRRDSTGGGGRTITLTITQEGRIRQRQESIITHRVRLET